MQRVPDDPLRTGAIFQLRSPIISPGPNATTGGAPVPAPPSSSQKVDPGTSHLRQIFDEIYRATPVPKEISSTDLLQRRPITHMINNLVAPEQRTLLSNSPAVSATTQPVQSSPNIVAAGTLPVSSPQAQTLSSILASSMIAGSKPASAPTIQLSSTQSSSSSNGRVGGANSSGHGTAADGAGSSSSSFPVPRGSPSIFAASPTGSRVSLLPASTLPSLMALQARAAQANAQAQISPLFPPRGPVPNSALSKLAASLSTSAKPIVYSSPMKKLNLLDPFAKPDTIKSPEKSRKSTEGVALLANKSNSYRQGDVKSDKKSSAQPSIKSPSKSSIKEPSAVATKKYAVLDSSSRVSEKSIAQWDTTRLDKQLLDLRRDLYNGRPRSKSLMNGLEVRVLNMTDSELRSLARQLKLECFPMTTSSSAPSSSSSSTSSSAAQKVTLTDSGIKRKSLDGRIERELAKYKGDKSLEGKKPTGLPKTPVSQVNGALGKPTAPAPAAGAPTGSRISRAKASAEPPPLLQTATSRPTPAPAQSASAVASVPRPSHGPVDTIMAPGKSSSAAAISGLNDAPTSASSTLISSIIDPLAMSVNQKVAKVAATKLAKGKEKYLPRQDPQDDQVFDDMDAFAGDFGDTSYTDFAPGFEEPDLIDTKSKKTEPKSKATNGATVNGDAVDPPYQAPKTRGRSLKIEKSSSVPEPRLEAKQESMITQKRGRPPKTNKPEPMPEVHVEPKLVSPKRGRPPKVNKSEIEPESEPESVAESAPLKRGRPPKVNNPEPKTEVEPVLASPKRGRPPKANKSEIEPESEPESVAESAPLKRGRPPKANNPEPKTEVEPVLASPKRGRPPKVNKSEIEPEPEPEVEAESAPLKRGRPPKAKKVESEIEPDHEPEVASSPKRGRPPKASKESASGIVSTARTNGEGERKRGRPPKLPGQVLGDSNGGLNAPDHSMHDLLSFGSFSSEPVKPVENNAAKPVTKALKANMESMHADPQPGNSVSSEAKPKKRGRPASSVPKPRSDPRDDDDLDEDQAPNADQPAKRKRIGAGEMKRMAKELSIAEEEDDIFNSGFFDNLNASSQSFYDLSTSHFATNDSFFEDVDFANGGTDDSFLNKSNAGPKKGKSGDWKATYVNKLSRKVKTISLTREDDEGQGDDNETSFRNKSDGSFYSSSLAGKVTKASKKIRAANGQDEEEEEEERQGSRLDDQVWEFKKGSMRVSSDIPYEGDLSGDEDGDFN